MKSFIAMNKLIIVLFCVSNVYQWPISYLNDDDDLQSYFTNFMELFFVEDYDIDEDFQLIKVDHQSGAVCNDGTAAG